VKTTPSPKRIGFIDYRLDNFHAEIMLDAIRGPLKGREFTVAGAWALLEGPSRSWASAHDLDFFGELAALDEHVDCYMVLAPSNPEIHRELCQRVFPLGKPTYVDKTFAPDIATARDLFLLADRYQVPVQTSSALRYTNVQTAVNSRNKPIRHLAVWGGGTSLEEYGIHVIELAISCLGAKATHVTFLGPASHPLFVLHFEGGQTASINFNPQKHTPYRVGLTFEDDTELITVDDSQLFVDAVAAILDFFETGAALIDRQESLLIRHILDIACANPQFGASTSLETARVVPAPKGLRHWEGKADSNHGLDTLLTK
jgi:hypothetical protein